MIDNGTVMALTIILHKMRGMVMIVPFGLNSMVD